MRGPDEGRAGCGGSGILHRVPGYPHQDQRRRQRRGVGLARHIAAGLRGHPDDGADPGVPDHPLRSLDEAHHRRHEGPGRHGPHRRQEHLPVPVPVYGPGGHGGHGQHRGRGRRHFGGWSRRGVLDVGHRLLRHDDQLLGKRAGHLLSPQEQRWRVVRRRHVLPQGRPREPEGLQMDRQGPGHAVLVVLPHRFLRHRQHDPGQRHLRPSPRGSRASSSWSWWAWW